MQVYVESSACLGQQVHKDSKRTPRTSEAESELRSVDSELLGEPAACGNSKSSASRKDRAWNDEKASTWFKVQRTGRQFIPPLPCSHQR